jgi:hypothetical protein
MAIVLTAAITVPNIGRAVLVRAHIFENSVQLEWEAKNVGSARVKSFVTWARNTVDGKCDVLQVNPTPVSFDDDLRVLGSSLASATAADQLEVAYRTGANKAAALRAVEQKCLDLGLCTLVGTVS